MLSPSHSRGSRPQRLVTTSTLRMTGFSTTTAPRGSVYRWARTESTYREACPSWSIRGLRRCVAAIRCLDSIAKGNHEIAQTVTEAAHPTLAKRAAPTSSSGWLRLEPTMTAPAPPISPHRSQMTAYLTPQPRANARSIDAPSSLRPEPKPGTLDPQVGPTGRRLASPISLPSWAHGREEGGWTAGATLWQ
jgi:hypothetical protein